MSEVHETRLANEAGAAHIFCAVVDPWRELELKRSSLRTARKSFFCGLGRKGDTFMYALLSLLYNERHSQRTGDTGLGEDRGTTKGVLIQKEHRLVISTLFL